MADAPHAEPLPPASLPLTLAEAPPATMINLRGPARDAHFVAAAAAALGVDLVRTPNRFAEAEGLRCIWQGPDEWLIALPEAGRAGLIARLEERLAGIHAAVTDVSGNRVTLLLGGARAEEILAAGCALDLGDAAAPAGTAVQTLLARVPVTILKPEGPARFEIQVRRSTAAYLSSWLLRAAEVAPA